MPKPVIVLNDTTSHGGQVVSAQSGITISGMAVACVGDSVECPLCNGTFLIHESSKRVCYQDMQLATEGMTTGCGATLVASQRGVEA